MARQPTPSQAFSQLISRQARGREVVPVRDPATGGIAFVRAVDLEAAQAQAATAAVPAMGRSDAGAGADRREPTPTPAQTMDDLIRRVAGPWDGRTGDGLVLVEP